MPNEFLTFEELHRALDRCMTAHPPEGIELKFHEDANQMAGLWGLMSYLRVASAPIAEVEPRVLESFKRWSIG